MIAALVIDVALIAIVEGAHVQAEAQFPQNRRITDLDMAHPLGLDEPADDQANAVDLAIQAISRFFGARLDHRGRSVRHPRRHP